jgi:hypothetical protein
LWLVEGKRPASTGSCVRPRSGQTCFQTKTSASFSSTPWRRPDTMSMDVWRKVDSGIDMRRTESAQSWTRLFIRRFVLQRPCFSLFPLLSKPHPYKAQFLNSQLNGSGSSDPIRAAPELLGCSGSRCKRQVQCLCRPHVCLVDSCGTLSGTSDLTPDHLANAK